MSYDLANLEFLVVDDMPITLEAYVRILTALGVRRTQSARNGDEAKEILRRNAPDILITDYKMAPTSGIELTKWVRQSPESSCRQAGIIMTSAFSEKERVEAARDAGVTEFLVKPVTPRNLYGRLATIIGNPRPFVQSPSFTGPCRRRMDDPNFIGPYKRHDDARFSPASVETVEDVIEI